MPKQEKLTESSVLLLKCLAKPYRVSDTGTDAVRGLEVLVSPLGTRTYRVNLARNKSMKLGRVEDMTLEDARDKARELRRKFTKFTEGQGHDPRQKQSTTFEEVVELWRKHQLRTHVPASVKSTMSFVLYSCADWKARQIGSITEGEITDLLEAKFDAGTKRASNRLHAHLNTLFKFALKRKWKTGLVTNPMAGVDRPWQVKRREAARKLDWFKGDKADDVVRAVWRYADSVGGDRGKFLKLLLITAKRANAVADMSWGDISADWYWTPPQRSERKANRPIPLPKLAQRVLGQRGEGRVLGGLGYWHQLHKRVRGVPDDFILHGIRHIVSTKLRELRVAPHVARMIVDRLEFDDMQSTYEHHDPRKEILAALERWCARIEALVAPGDKVRVLR